MRLVVFKLQLTTSAFEDILLHVWFAEKTVRFQIIFFSQLLSWKYFDVTTREVLQKGPNPTYVQRVRMLLLLANVELERAENISEKYLGTTGISISDVK